VSDVGSRVWPALGRHQVVAAAATVLDFAWMAFAVERLGVAPGGAAFTGAALGTVASFLLGRAWVFRARWSEAWGLQAARFALVAGVSATLNGLGEHVLHDLSGVGYLTARVLVAVAVGVVWNFPMQLGFVFGDGGSPPRAYGQ
jgi:putative flippase GtrA